MLFILGGIYLLVGSVYAFTNFIKWVSPVLFVIFLPFMIVHAFVYGDSKKRNEAITILKGGLVIATLYFVCVGLIMLYQKF